MRVRGGGVKVGFELWKATAFVLLVFLLCFTRLMPAGREKMMMLGDLYEKGHDFQLFRRGWQ